jgi:hypothetical protein
MTKTTPQKTIAGESLRLLERAERHVRIEPDPRGIRITADLPPKVDAPFTRALMRVEAEMLRSYADANSADASAPLPPPDMVRAVAIAELLRRIAYQTDTPPELSSDGTIDGI